MTGLVHTVLLAFLELPGDARHWVVYILIALIAILVLPVILTTIVACFEKRMIWPYGNLETQPQFLDVDGYGAQWVADAQKEGFHFLGWAPDLKGSIYQVNYGFVVSPNREHFALIGVGTVLQMQVCGTWIYTMLADNKAIYSTDNQACVHVDVSRNWRSHLVSANTFADLLQSHRNSIHDLGLVPKPFSAGQEVEAFKRFQEQHYQLMARSGFIAFTDASSRYWHYTLYGALKFSVLNHFIALTRKITNGRSPRLA